MAGAEGLTDSPHIPLEHHEGQEIAVSSPHLQETPVGETGPEGAVVCSNCERTGHHLRAGCHEQLSEEEISEGAELCSNCELEETGTAMIHVLEE